MKTKLMIAAVCAVAVSTAAWAGTEGHGGSGMYVGGQLLLADFVDNGLATGADLGANDPSDMHLSPSTIAKIHSCLGAIEKADAQGSETIDLLIAKLAQMGGHNSAASAFFLSGMCNLQWILVPGPLNDVEHPAVATDRKIVQLAIRRDASVRLDQDRLWQLPIEHRVGLLFHETAYFLLQNFAGYNGVSADNVTATVASDFTGLLFNGTFLRNFKTSSVVGKVYELFFYRDYLDSPTLLASAASAASELWNLKVGTLTHLYDLSSNGNARPINNRSTDLKLISKMEALAANPTTLHLPYARSILQDECADLESASDPTWGVCTNQRFYMADDCRRLQAVEEKLNQWYRNPS